jgi:hypothetical protein
MARGGPIYAGEQNPKISIGERAAAVVDNPSPCELRCKGADRDVGAEHGEDRFAAATNAPLEGNESGVGLESEGELVNVFGEVGQVGNFRKT